MNWKFEEEKGGGAGYKLIPAGVHLVRIASAEEQLSKTGKEMAKLVIDVSGYESQIFHYVVLDGTSDEAIKRTNRTLTSIFNSFGIKLGDMNLRHWVGKTGVAMVKHEEYNGYTNPKIHYFLTNDDERYDDTMDNDWVDANSSSSAKAASDGFGDGDGLEISGDDLPF